MDVSSEYFTSAPAPSFEENTQKRHKNVEIVPSAVYLHETSTHRLTTGMTLRKLQRLLRPGTTFY